MFTGGNPFDTDTTVRKPCRPRFRIVEIHPDCVEVEVEIVDENGIKVFTTHHGFFTPGDSITLSNLTIDIAITHKD